MSTLTPSELQEAHALRAVHRRRNADARHDPANLPRAVAGQHPGGLTDLGNQHDLPARCGTLEPGGVCGQCLFHCRHGALRGANRCGGRLSYLLGTVTLAASTLLYVLLWRIHAPFWEWAVVSVLIGLGFTFFSGAVEAWLVDALKATGFTGELEAVFGRGQVVTGVAMLSGSVAGGLIAQQTSLGVPFVLRALILGVMFVVALRLMHDVGFSPEKAGGVLTEIRKITSASIEYGLRVPAVKWLMIESLFTGGVGIYGFYALQPYLLPLYGDRRAYLIAGLA